MIMQRKAISRYVGRRIAGISIEMKPVRLFG